MKKIFLFILLINLLLTAQSFAFTEMTSRTLEQFIQKAMQGNIKAKKKVISLWQ